jgi:hypothetical protein
MTYHTALVILDSAQKTHRVEHRHALTLDCFISALRDNADAAGYEPLEFTKQWTRILPKLLKNNFIKIGEEDSCGRKHLSLTLQGKGMLEYWNLHGCQSHQRRGQTREQAAKCVAPILHQRLSRAHEAA